MVVTPTVAVRVQPLGRFERKGIGAVGDGPVFIAVRKRVEVGINTAEPVRGGRAANERAGIGLRGVVDKLPDVPKGSSGVQRRVVPIITVAVLVGVVPLRHVIEKCVRFADRMSVPRLVAVQTSGVRVGERIAIRIQAAKPVGRGVPTAKLAVIALKTVQVVSVPIVIGIEPLRWFSGEGVGPVLDTPAAVRVGPAISVAVGAPRAIVGGGPNQADAVVARVHKAVLVRIPVRFID